MNSTILHIKNMVCNRCIKVVRDELTMLNIPIEEIELGRVSVSSILSNTEIEKVRTILENNGFELIDDKKSQLIERIKTIVIELIHYNKEVTEPINSSEFISKTLEYDYSYLSHLFSSSEGITIEKYMINQKIEKAKELLIYDELSINEIAFKLGYSSVQHLSSQFKKISGLSPSHFKKLKNNKRKPLDEV